jgi:glucosamine 6-phosphate synthetase-like amidotransferase/phosphosugar isomerase protein
LVISGGNYLEIGAAVKAWCRFLPPGSTMARETGRGPRYSVALEGALKRKEISSIHAEVYHAAELKHGPIALLEKGTPVIAPACDIPGKDKTLGNIEECHARGARILGIVTDGDQESAECMDDFIAIPRCHPLVATCPSRSLTKCIMGNFRVFSRPRDRP